MRYEKLAQLYEEISSTKKRLKKIDILSKFLEYITEEDSYILYLIQGNIYPDYDERKLGISNQLAIKTIAKATGTTSEKVISEWKKIGDLGETAKKLTENKKQMTLATQLITTKKVIENLRKLSELEGKGTIDKKISLITELLTSATPIESLYLTRTVLGDLRIGVQESTIKYAILKTFFNNNKEHEEKLQKAIDRSNDLVKVFNIARKGDIQKIEKIELEIGKPARVMLGPKAKSIKEAFESLGSPMAVEYKYDGFRIMIHKKKSEIKIFTRRLENVTKQFPEIEEFVKKYVKGNSFILDCEAVGYDRKTKKYTDFQKISQRIRRKYNIEKLQEELPVEINVFDIINYEGESYLEKPFKERRKLIEKIITPEPYKLIYSKLIEAHTEQEVKDFYKEALKNNQEGVFLKKLDAPYKPGKRVGNWLKLKPEENDLDLVIVGGEWGTGKRSGWISSFNLACQKNGEFFEIGKVGTGVSEKDEEGKVTFEQLTNLLKPLITKEKGKDIKVTPKIIVSVTYQDIQKSPNYSSGWALRFPRITDLREDKPLIEIATIEEIEDAYFREKKKSYSNY